MNRSFVQFTLVLLLAVLYETAANVAHHRYHRHHRQFDEPCIPAHNGISLCSNLRHYPFEGVSDAVNEVREILSSHPLNESRLNEIDPEVYNFDSEPHEVVIQNLPEDVGDCQTEVQDIYPEESRTFKDGQPNFFIVNIPSLRQHVQSIRCNCQNSVHHTKCKQVFREERLLSLPGDKSRFNVGDFSITAYMIPYGCACSA